MPEVTIIVPTYNEADCIEPLFHQIASDLDGESLDYAILVVDDNSPDGTAAEVQRLQEGEGYPARAHVRTENPGLSESVVDGLRLAEGDIAIVMDADLQHPPSAIPDLVAEIGAGSDIAVGSRRAEGGGFGDWSYHRKLVSLGAEVLAKSAVPAAREVSDPMSGLFAAQLDRVPVDDLNPTGFKILLEILAVVDDAAVSEVGYKFGTRTEGESKLTADEYLNFLVHLASCRARTLPTPVPRR